MNSFKYHYFDQRLCLIQAWKGGAFSLLNPTQWTLKWFKIIRSNN